MHDSYREYSSVQGYFWLSSTSTSDDWPLAVLIATPIAQEMPRFWSALRTAVYPNRNATLSGVSAFISKHNHLGLT
jgi:hypothetical protein